MHTLGRRGFFLSALAGLMVADHTLDPERLLWVPGNKLISIPKVREPLVRVVEFKNGPGIANVKSIQDSIVRLHQLFPDYKPYDVGGQVIFPCLDARGRLRSSILSYMVAKDWKSRASEEELTHALTSTTPSHVIYYA